MSRILRPTERRVLLALTKGTSDQVFSPHALVEIGAAKAGTIYTTLAALHKDKLVSHQEVDLGPETIGPRRRKIYSITLLGRVLLALTEEGGGLARVYEILDRHYGEGA